MKVSVITPSRLAINPVSVTGNLFLDRALMSAKHQTADVDVEFVVGADPGSGPLPARFSDVTLVNASEPGQAAAVNMAVSVSTGDIIALLEDDDVWDPLKLAAQLPLLDTFDLVTCNQREVDEDGNFLRYNNFPTPSGWVMRRETWDKVGGFDTSYRWHVDTEWLGRARVAGVTRVHVMNDGHTRDNWLERVEQRSAVVVTEHVTEPLVHRFKHDGSGMSRILSEQAEREWSDREHHQMIQRFGEVPW